ncbi:MAG: hypothetical protein LBS62_03875 [Clostridiales bacterium]|jgi:hypothetical protein|nr:hypothetical protein [Clostridiales bacterium]
MYNRLLDVLENKSKNYILPFFWQHGEDEKILREYMQVIHNANIGAVCVESRPHPDFCGEKWWTDMDAILDEAARLNMKVWILDDSHFPTGYANGSMENVPKELRHQYLDYNTLNVCGPKPAVEIDVNALIHPRPAPPWLPPPPPKRVFNDDKLFKVLAAEYVGDKLGESIDLTEFAADGRLVWNVPKGYWRIFIVYLTRDANGRNDYINFLDERSCRVLIDAVYETHYERYKNLFGSVIAGFFSDEPPIGNSPGYTRNNRIGDLMPLPWSAAMPDKFSEEYGAGWKKQVIYLWEQGVDEEETARIRSAYMHSVSKLVENCFSGQIGRWCEEHGVLYIGHMLEDCDANADLGPSMGHFFRGLKGQHMAGIDNIGGQVVIGGQNSPRFPAQGGFDVAGFYHYLLGRLGASMAAIDANKQGRCLCENFGAYGWQTGVSTMKYLTDHFLVRGVNRYVPHAFSPKKFPDPDCPPHFYARGENPQYKAFAALMAYTNRVCHLIDGGKPITPAAVLYHGESRWAGAYQSNIEVCKILTRNQIGFTVIPADVFGRTSSEYGTALSADGKTLTINGVAFSALIISECDYMPYQAALFAERALSCGFPLFFTGKLPKGVCDAEKAESKRLMALLGARAVPVPAVDIPNALAPYVKRDVIINGGSFQNLTAYRYKNTENGAPEVPDSLVYLLLNEDPCETFGGGTSGAAQIALEGAAEMEVYKYDAWNNQLFEVPSKTVSSGCGRWIDITLEPLEMAIFVCQAEKIPSRRQSKVRESLELDGFTVSCAAAGKYPSFDREPGEQGRREAPFSRSAVFAKRKFRRVGVPDFINGMGLILKDFTGFIRYETTFEAQPGFIVDDRYKNDVFLCLEQVYDTAEIYVNGKSVGSIVCKPYKINIGGYLNNGTNSIIIEVATTLERKVIAMGLDVACMNIPAPVSPIGIVGRVRLEK